MHSTYYMAIAIIALRSFGIAMPVSHLSEIDHKSDDFVAPAPGSLWKKDDESDDFVAPAPGSLWKKDDESDDFVAPAPGSLWKK
jgi:hypothetical protein